MALVAFVSKAFALANVNNETLKLNKNDLGLLFGDLPKDIDIGNGLNTINCAFLNDQDIKNYDSFNVVLTGESSFNNVSKLLIKK